mmetsp:Transcript_117906/g.334332  ORF Transcript_117906/g.334332 Transcript_117906/m.334332 type:complete len:324 (-) Transcript_117906:279-1250(-)
MVPAPGERRECAGCGEGHPWSSGRFSKTQWAKGELASRCKSCVSSTGTVGGAVGDGSGGFTTVRNNATERYAETAGDTSLVAKVYQSRVFAQGAFKVVYKGLYTGGSRHGEECVFKAFKPKVAHRADYFDKDVLAAEKAAEIVDAWNRRAFVRMKIRVNVPEIMEPGRGHAHREGLVEPYVYNWVKFNSNSGWYRDIDEVDEVMQALSHFSYHATGGSFLLCDLQGGVYRDGVILSDPMIISREAERYGGGDLGPWGMSTFFSRHRCNGLCCEDWTMPRDASTYFECKKGSSLIGNQGIPTTGYLNSLEPLSEEEESDESYGW